MGIGGPVGKGERAGRGYEIPLVGGGTKDVSGTPYRLIVRVGIEESMA